MPKRIIKKIRDLRDKHQKAGQKAGPKKTKPKTTKAKISFQEGIQRKIEEIIEQRQQAGYERILKRKEKRLKKQLAHFAHRRKSLKGDYKSRFPIFGRGKDEDAQEVERYESRLSLEHQLELELQKVQRVLEKVKAGKYGICVLCGKRIQSERLKIYPEAEHCMDCHKKGL